MEHDPHRNPDKPERQDDQDSLLFEILQQHLLEQVFLPDIPNHVLVRALQQHILENTTEAFSRHEQIPALTARLIAFAVELFTPGRTTGPLLEFFSTGRGKHDQLREAYLPVYQDPAIPEALRVDIDTLGDFLFHREHPEIIAPKGHLRLHTSLHLPDYEPDNPAALPRLFRIGRLRNPDHLWELTSEIGTATAKFGTAFLAYLRLPGVNAAKSGLVEDFLVSYIGTIEDLDRLLLNQERDHLRQPNAGPSPPFLRDGVEIAGTTHFFYYL